MNFEEETNEIDYDRVEEYDITNLRLTNEAVNNTFRCNKCGNTSLTVDFTSSTYHVEMEGTSISNVGIIHCSCGENEELAEYSHDEVKISDISPIYSVRDACLFFLDKTKTLEKFHTL